MFYQIFFPPQVKRFAIITYKHVIHHLLHELPKNVRLRILGTICPTIHPTTQVQGPQEIRKHQESPKTP